MPDPTELKNVPPEKVARKVGQLIRSGATTIRCVKQNNGNWTIRAS
jgi:hypothetical protein